MPAVHRFLRLLSLTVAGLLLVAAAVNMAVDPYRMVGWIDRPGFNAAKPRIADHVRVAKPYLSERVQPRTIVLGSSRAEAGIDPASPLWPAADRPVFNLALPGAGLYEQRRMLQHVLASGVPRRVLLGLELVDFLFDPARPPRADAATEREWERRLAVRADGRPNTERSQQWLVDMSGAVISLSALVDSLVTVGAQGNPEAQTLTPLGFNPMTEYAGHVRTNGYFGVFEQKNQEYARFILRQPRHVVAANGPLSPGFAELIAILNLARQHRIELILFIHPYHAELLEAQILAGLLPATEAWKRELVALLDREAAARLGARVPLWDFNGYDAYTTERVPPPGDRAASMRWYWEPAHYKRELGERMLARMLGQSGERFGSRLERLTIDAMLAESRAGQARYRGEQPESAARIRHHVDSAAWRAAL
jgi:hypothetical protein